MNQNQGRDRRDENDGWRTVGAAAAGIAAAAGLTYWLTSGKKQNDKPQTNKSQTNQPQTNKPSKPQTNQPSKPQTNKPSPPKKPNPPPSKTAPRPESSSSGSSMFSMVNMLLKLGSSSSGSLSSSSSSSGSPSGNEYYSSGKVGEQPTDNPCISNLNGLLADIHVRFIQLRDDDFKLHYNVFDKLFRQLHEKMMEVDLYYKKYNSTRQFAGSHYDNLRIKKPDEFDMDIVIRLPLNISESQVPNDSDIVIEPKSAGYVSLKMGAQFQNLPMRDGGEWETNKAAYKWMDGSNYLLRSKFMDWWKGVVGKALNQFQRRGINQIPILLVDGVEYEVHRSESGPAMTLFIKNASRGFKLDVDLVPALKFPETRWPITPYYRHIPRNCCKNTWMVVGKENKSAPSHERERSWRLALHNQERELMHNSYHLRQAVRLLKKLRDEQGMKKIASYYIKTLFFWEIVEQNSEQFWRNNPAFLFTHMVKKLHAALVEGNIPYFWNKRNNLIENVDTRILSQYAAKLVPLMKILDNPSGDNYKLVAKYLLSNTEYIQYKSRFL